MSWLINAAQLDRFRKDQKNVVVFDASWYLPEENKNAQEDFLKSHILGARFFSLDLFHDLNSPFPCMLIRDEKKIAELLGKLGITNEHKIIFYDKSKLHTSCRARWMFTVFGHPAHQLYILNGGYSAWEKYGGKTESGERPIVPRSYTVNFAAHFIRTLLQMKTNFHHPTEQVIDLRHPVRYAGGPEKRAHLRRGHIPGSFCFPYFTMFEADGQFKPLEKIRKQLKGIGVELEVPIVTLCGSGITAAILNNVLDLLGYSNHALYDASWSEWGSTELYSGEVELSERPVRTSLE